MFKIIKDFVRKYIVAPIKKLFAKPVEVIDNVTTEVVTTVKEAEAIECTVYASIAAIVTITYVALVPFWVSAVTAVAALALTARYCHKNNVKFFYQAPKKNFKRK